MWAAIKAKLRRSERADAGGANFGNRRRRPADGLPQSSSWTRRCRCPLHRAAPRHSFERGELFGGLHRGVSGTTHPRDDAG